MRYELHEINLAVRCENNYVHSKYIAEFFNTFSNLGYVVVGYFAYNHDISVYGEATTFGAAYVALATTGVGSMLFHGTLTKESQLADELPLTWLILLMFLGTLEVNDAVDSGEVVRRGKTKCGIAAYGVVMTVAQIFNPGATVLSPALVAYAGASHTTFVTAAACRTLVAPPLLPLVAADSPFVFQLPFFAMSIWMLVQIRYLEPQQPQVEFALQLGQSLFFLSTRCWC